MAKNNPPAPAGRPARGAQDIAAKRVQNSKSSVNKLSPEVLSHIFLAGEEEERGSRKRSVAYSYIGFQELASHVCSYWRDVAIHTPALWTYIHITTPNPNRLAYLYISRVPKTALFDIDINLRSKYWYQCIGSSIDRSDRLRMQESHISSIFLHLSTHGAPVNRWKSLQVYSREIKVLLKFLRCLNLHSAPTLRFLSFKSKLTKHNLEVNIHPSVALYHRLLESSAPNLRCVEFTKLPWETLLNPHLLLPFAGLTSLSLVAEFMPQKTSDFYNLLSASPRLESLCINPPVVHYVNDAPATERVCMSFLRSLSILGNKGAHWALRILKLVDAPLLESLCISTSGGYDENLEIAEYIATAKSPHGSPNNSQSIYPRLRELDISGFICPSSHHIARVLLALPSVTRLLIRNHTNVLGMSPWPLPNLEILTFPSPDHYYTKLREVLHRRAEAGFHVKVVRVAGDWAYQGIYRQGLPDFVRLQECPALVAPQDHVYTRERACGCACSGMSSGDETSEEEDSEEEDSEEEDSEEEDSEEEGSEEEGSSDDDGSDDGGSDDGGSDDGGSDDGGSDGGSNDEDSSSEGSN